MGRESVNRRSFLGVSAASLISAGMSHAQTAPARQRNDAGVRMVPVVNGKYKVWTRKVGSGSTMVLLLHGGPGVGHEYLESMESFLPQAGMEMYYYDQLGCVGSDQPADLTLWTLARYVEEVEEVRRGLGLEQFVLYGHSWGGMLAIEYALKYPRPLRGLVISNMCAGTQAYLKRAEALKVQMLSGASLARLRALEAKRDYDNPEYGKILTDELYPQMLCRSNPWPEAVTRSFGHLNQKI
jgi:proline iminopeptidase